MIFTFYRALGMSTGASMVEEDFIEMARLLIKKAEAKGVKLLLPKDVVVADKFAADAATQQVRADLGSILVVGDPRQCCVRTQTVVMCIHKTRLIR